MQGLQGASRASYTPSFKIPSRAINNKPQSPTVSICRSLGVSVSICRSGHVDVRQLLGKLDYLELEKARPATTVMPISRLSASRPLPKLQQSAKLPPLPTLPQAPVPSKPMAVASKKLLVQAAAKSTKGLVEEESDGLIDRELQYFRSGVPAGGRLVEVAGSPAKAPVSKSDVESVRNLLRSKLKICSGAIMQCINLDKLC